MVSLDIILFSKKLINEYPRRLKKAPGVHEGTRLFVPSYHAIKERFGEIMGGKVLELETDKLIRQGMEQGMEQGIAKGMEQERQNTERERQKAEAERQKAEAERQKVKAAEEEIRRLKELLAEKEK